MAIVNFYACSANMNIVRKKLSHEVTADAHFIEPTSIEDPVLKLSKSIDFDAYNYVYIPLMNRYYYVADKPTFEQGFYTVKLHIDVLMSHISKFLSQDVILKRQSNKYNLYQDDNEFRVLQFQAIRTQEFPSGFSSGVQAFVLGVVGNTSSEFGGDKNV